MLPLISIALAAPAVAPMTEIAVYQRLTESDLTLVDVPDELEHDDLLRDPAEAIGRIALEPLLPGEPLRAQRLGDDARSTLLGPDDDLVLMRLERPEDWAPGRVDLVALPEGQGACLLAQGVRTHGSPEPGLISLAMPAVDAHRLRWAIEQQRVLPIGRNPIDRDLRPELGCDGGLPVHELVLEAGSGRLLRLDVPAGDLLVSHPDRVHGERVTPTDVWLHGVGVGHTGAALFLQSNQPPAILDLTVVPPETPSITGEPVGGLVVLEPNGVDEARIWPADAGTVTIDKARAFVRTDRPGRVQVYTRTIPGEIALHDVSFIDGWPPPARGEPVMPLKPGKRRKVVMTRRIVGAWVGDPSVASVELKGRKARVSALRKGTTRVVVMDEEGALSSTRVVIP